MNCCWIACIIVISIIGIAIISSVLGWPWILKTCPFQLSPMPEIIEGYIPTNISFSSCMANWRDHRLMNHIHSDLHIFLGDNIYGDDYNYEFEYVKPDFLWWVQLPTHIVAYYELLYRKLSCRKSFQDLVKRVPLIVSTWDDHDYGSDDELINNTMKQEAKRMFVKFWNLNQARKNVTGIYGSYKFTNQSSSVLLILPDLRFSTSNERLFDQEQWSWLTGLLQQNKDSSIILCMSVPVRGLLRIYPEETRALLSMLNKSTTVIISGDPHVPSITHLPYGHIDITSSPLAMVGISKHEYTVCNNSCSVINNQDNYGLINLHENTVTIMSEEGPLLQTRIMT